MPIISDIQKTHSSFPVNLPTVQCVMAIFAKYLPTNFFEEALSFSGFVVIDVLNMNKVLRRRRLIR